MESRKRQRTELTSTSATACRFLGEEHAAGMTGRGRLPDREILGPGSGDRLHQDALIKLFLRELEEQAQALQQLLNKHAVSEGLGNDQAMASAKDIVTYSHKLCYTTFAPPAYQAGVTVLHNFRPPMPQEWQLRASKLHAHTKRQDRPTSQADDLAVRTNEDQLGAMHSQLPQAPQEKQAVLPELPPMPAGWKPGDPILGDDAGAPAKAGAATSKELEKQPDKHAELPMFELILNPEWEDAEEEFSDEDTDD